MNHNSDINKCLLLALQGEDFRYCQIEDEFRGLVFELLSIYGMKHQGHQMDEQLINVNDVVMRRSGKGTAAW